MAHGNEIYQKLGCKKWNRKSKEVLKKGNMQSWLKKNKETTDASKKCWYKKSGKKRN